MLSIIDKNKKQIIVIILFIFFLPIIVQLLEIIFALGKYNGMLARYYIEGICIK